MPDSTSPGSPAGAELGRVTELWRYPVKSMLGEPLGQAGLSAAGVEGDRRFGVVDPSSGYVLSAKTVPALLTATARIEGDGVVIARPDGREVSSGDPSVGIVLSGWLGRTVELRETGTPEVRFELGIDPTDDEHDIIPWPALDGTFLDSALVHLLTTASLTAMASGHPDAQWDVRRFRPNVVVEVPASAAAGAPGFVEDTWLGTTVGLGEAGAALSIDDATARCAMPSRAQPEHAGRAALDRDLGVHRALKAGHGDTLGVYCGVASPGPVTVGDAVAARG